jgi:hypothetical protein
VENAENAQEEEARNPLPINDRKDTIDVATDPKDDNALATTSEFVWIQRTGTEPPGLAPQPGAAVAAVLQPPFPPPPTPRSTAYSRLSSPGSHSNLPLSALPAMPPPRLRTMRAEAAGGCTSMLAIIALCVGGTHWSVLGLGEMENPLPPFFLCSIWAEALIACLCLAGLMFCDPGVVARSESRCWPVPDSVSCLLRVGLPIPTDMENIEDHAHGTYCVRCLVWRHRDESAHHCATCQRCVTDFDHHCGVLGRCIAGRGVQGNIGYCRGLITMALIGIVTFVTALALGFK